MAPARLPLPPTMIIVQMRKVPKKWVNVSGLMARFWKANMAPPMPMITPPRTNACVLNAKTFLPLAAVLSSSSRNARSTRPQGERTLRSSAI